MTEADTPKHIIAGPESARIWIDGKPYINFVGSSYLALQSRNELKEAAKRAIELGHPWSQMRSSAYAGSDPVFDEFETEAAIYFDKETAVFIPSGYLCGMAAVAGLRGQFDVVCIDELAHFSLWDAAQLSQCSVLKYAHADADSLRDNLRKIGKLGQRPLVLTDGVFATTGRLPPLDEYERALNEIDGLMFVDESHAYGVLGKHGRGAVEYFSLDNVLHGGSIGKGLCAQGGVIPCNRDFAKRIRALPPLRGAGAGAPVSALVGAAAMRLAKTQTQQRSHLHYISQRLKVGLRTLGLDVIETPAPITAFIAGSNANMHSIRKALLEEGIQVLVSNYIGAGPEGMIRCGTFADHSIEDVDLLITVLRGLL